MSYKDFYKQYKIFNVAIVVILLLISGTAFAMERYHPDAPVVLETVMDSFSNDTSGQIYEWRIIPKRGDDDFSLKYYFLD